MSLIIVDGFDHYATADIAKKGGSTAGFTAPSIVASGRFGGSFLRTVYGGSGAAGNVTWSLKGNRRTVYFSVAVRPTTWSSNDTMLSVYDGATKQCELVRTTGGSVLITRNNTTIATLTGSLTANVWGHVSGFITVGDVTGNASTYGAYSITINGVTDSATNVDTKASANAFATDIRLGTTLLGSACTCEFDDFIVDSATNWGDKRVQTLTVQGAGNSADFTPSTGSNYENVDDATLDETNYNDSTTIGHADTFAASDVGTGAAVGAVAVTVMAQTTDGGGSIRPVLRIGGTTYDLGVDQALSATTTALQGFFEVNPATVGAWTAAALNGAEPGYKKTA